MPMWSQLRSFIRDLARFAYYRSKAPIRLPRPENLRPARGRALLVYVERAFKTTRDDSFHSNLKEARVIATTLMEQGFEVSVIDCASQFPVDCNEFDVLFGMGDPFYRSFARPFQGIRIFYATGAPHCFSNQAAVDRLIQFRQRHGTMLLPRRNADMCFAAFVSLCDAVLLIGNEWTASTYRHYGVPIHFIPVTTSNAPDLNRLPRNYDTTRKSFLWLGSGGAVHKGLDLVLDAMKMLDETYTLHVCGPVDREPDFFQVYRSELTQTTNIHYHGFVNVSSEETKKIYSQCAFTIFPTCSEGTASSVITCMLAGLVPVVTASAGVNLDDFGILIADLTPAAVAERMRAASQLPAEDVCARSERASNYVKAHHSLEAFEKAFKGAFEKLLTSSSKKAPV